MAAVPIRAFRAKISLMCSVIARNTTDYSSSTSWKRERTARVVPYASEVWAVVVLISLAVGLPDGHAKL